MDNQAKGDKPWVIRDVPEDTRRDVKAFAAKNGITIAEALAFLVSSALGKVKDVELSVPPIDLSNGIEIDRLIRLLEDLKANSARYVRENEAE